MTDDNFAGLGLSEPIRRALRARRYDHPTPIQRRAIPLMLGRKDLVGIAQTGTGKTAAFVLPILEHLARTRTQPGPGTVKVLILAPTRELAIQIDSSIRSYGPHLGLIHAVVVGGVGHGPQIDALRRGLHILVATPGRLLDHLSAGHVRLDQVSTFVLDEADRMLDMGFIRDVRRIVAKLPRRRQSAMFSATMAPDIAELAGQILSDPERIALSPQSIAADRIEHNVVFVGRAGKLELLETLLADPAVARAIVFTRTKRGATRVALQIGRWGVAAEALHGNKSQTARQRSLARFADGHARVLVATDIAARGLDIDNITHVINFELPHEPEWYVHRIGRTARAGAGGVAISLCGPEERANLRAIEKLMRHELVVLKPALGDTNSAVAASPVAKPARPRTAYRHGQPRASALSLARRPNDRPRRPRGMMPSATRKDPIMPNGTVKWFNSQKGFGFIRPDEGGDDVFLHKSAIERSGMGNPSEGQKVSYDTERDRRGRLSATNVRARA